MADMFLRFGFQSASGQAPSTSGEARTRFSTFLSSWRRRRTYMAWSRRLTFTTAFSGRSVEWLRMEAGLLRYHLVVHGGLRLETAIRSVQRWRHRVCGCRAVDLERAEASSSWHARTLIPRVVPARLHKVSSGARREVVKTVLKC
jgi:hypothetical protein